MPQTARPLWSATVPDRMEYLFTASVSDILPTSVVDGCVFARARACVPVSGWRCASSASWIRTMWKWGQHAHVLKHRNNITHSCGKDFPLSTTDDRVSAQNLSGWATSRQLRYAQAQILRAKKQSQRLTYVTSVLLCADAGRSLSLCNGFHAPRFCPTTSRWVNCRMWEVLTLADFTVFEK
jgi:hypothetical protein